MKLISFRLLAKVYRRHFTPIAYMKARYPKAAKRKRIQNKWRNRFGEDVGSFDCWPSENLFFREFKNED